MKVLDLCCGRGHGFEGWFASDEDFVDQHDRQLIECPLCADKSISKRPSAPRLNLSGARESVAAPGMAGEPQALGSVLQAAWMKAVRHVVQNTEDVGERFSDEARRMHYGEVAARSIRGLATAAQREALADEGIPIATLAIPEALKEPLQ
ncbi:DUF1178 family protein [Aquincola sp. MAHUQ-54]|uniref:DUF1178 family protein n=1 Tax=Aquincola agrisoli TaxID=3119538 RepID=A0AAW9QFJ1_9BURK